jgi:hypothetical protein
MALHYRLLARRGRSYSRGRFRQHLRSAGGDRDRDDRNLRKQAIVLANAQRILTGTAAAGGIALVNCIGNLGGFVGPYAVGCGPRPGYGRCRARLNEKSLVSSDFAGDPPRYSTPCTV